VITAFPLSSLQFFKTQKENYFNVQSRIPSTVSCEMRCSVLILVLRQFNSVVQLLMGHYVCATSKQIFMQTQKNQIHSLFKTKIPRNVAKCGVASPNSKMLDRFVSVVPSSLDQLNWFLRLLKQNFRPRNKNYFTVQSKIPRSLEYFSVLGVPNCDAQSNRFCPYCDL